MMPPTRATTSAVTALDRHRGTAELLVEVVQELSAANDLDAITAIVRRAARELLGADGATFVLRQGDRCYYAAENAISPLWQGQSFPLNACVSGWVIQNAQPAVIPDIYADERVPTAAYRPTFVKSLAMVPIRLTDPVGAIGNYWADSYTPTPTELSELQALANVTSVAMENVGLHRQLLAKIRDLEESNEELQRFAWIASHDLKSPLRGVDNLAQWLEEDLGSALQGPAREHMTKLRRRVRRLERLLDDVLDYARLTQHQSTEEELVQGSQLIADLTDLVDIPSGFILEVSATISKVVVPRLAMQRVLCNLVDNAIKHHHRKAGRVVIDLEETEASYVFRVRDDGPGIAPEHHERIFEMFQTLQPRDVRDTSGMGLAMVRKTLRQYGSDVIVDSELGRGAVFRFAWPKRLEAPAI